MSISYTVFTKPWKNKTLPELAKFVADLGFDGVEFPIRPGFQVEPEGISKGLLEAAGIFADHGVRIATLAGPTDEVTIAACAEAGVPIIRVCEKIDLDRVYGVGEEAEGEGGAGDDLGTPHAGRRATGSPHERTGGLGETKGTSAGDEGGGHSQSAARHRQAWGVWAQGRMQKGTAAIGIAFRHRGCC